MPDSPPDPPRRGGRPRVGEPTDRGGASKGMSCKLTASALAAVDALAAKEGTTRAEVVRRALRELLAVPPTDEQIAAFEPRRLYGAGLVPFVIIPEAGQKAALAALATERGVAQYTLVRYAVAQLLAST